MFFERPLHRALTTLCTASAVLLLQADLIAAQGTQAAEPEEPASCVPDSDCWIPYEYLASQETDPYQAYGKLVSAEKRATNQLLPADARAAKRWPDVQSCLVREERTAEMPDITQMNWRKMRRAEDIEVCLFRVAASIGNPGGMKKWLIAQGLRYEGEQRSEVHVNIASDSLPMISVPILVQHAGNKPNQTKRTYLAPFSPVARYLRFLIVHGETFTVVWSDEGDVMYTGFDTTVE